MHSPSLDQNAYYETSEDLCFRFVVVAVWKLGGSNGVQRIAFACSIADADTLVVKVQIVEPESAKSDKATQAKEIVRTPSTSNNLLGASDASIVHLGWRTAFRQPPSFIVRFQKPNSNITQRSRRLSQDSNVIE
ncbi:hypothetical protein BV898_19322 [Hypsibius exemplaris]|uniref:Uncharacterized protein n=1 Tax=Hypsibius exemplaris TaxID=2072580 RepID=A0A9X6RPH5_HYPEX|nr:hypothetical protein BV898_19322 [Hypsibius exemplaris]